MNDTYSENDMISRQDAINLVMDVCNAILSSCGSHYDEEIRDEVYDDIKEVDAILKCNKKIRSALRNLPSAQPEIVRCKNCKHGMYDMMCKFYWCHGVAHSANWYCADAERRTDE